MAEDNGRLSHTDMLLKLLDKAADHGERLKRTEALMETVQVEVAALRMSREEALTKQESILYRMTAAEHLAAKHDVDIEGTCNDLDKVELDVHDLKGWRQDLDKKKAVDTARAHVSLGGRWAIGANLLLIVVNGAFALATRLHLGG